MPEHRVCLVVMCSCTPEGSVLHEPLDELSLADLAELIRHHPPSRWSAESRQQHLGRAIVPTIADLQERVKGLEDQLIKHVTNVDTAHRV